MAAVGVVAAAVGAAAGGAAAVAVAAVDAVAAAVGAVAAAVDDDVIRGWSSQPFQLSFPFLDFSMATTVTPAIRGQCYEANSTVK